MNELEQKIQELIESPFREKADERALEFRKFKERNSKSIFKELCFCLLTANFNAERAIKIQEEIDDGFISLSEKKLSKKLKELGYRYPNTRAGYVVEARKHIPDLKKNLRKYEGKALRDWVVENVKGLGMKESSHFLRNIGYTDYAIIDFHIVDVLVSHKICDKPKTMSKKAYVEIEEKLKKIGVKFGLDQAKLDLYLWYLETGKLLK